MNESGLKVGTVGYPLKNRKRVFDGVDVIELTEGRGAPSAAKTGRRWRQEVPRRIDISLQLSALLFEPPAREGILPGERDRYGGFARTEENARLWTRELELAKATEAVALVLITPTAFTPAPVNRDALASFLAFHPRPDCEIVWEPHGPWERDQAASFAQENGLVLAVDPLRDAPPGGPFAYFRLGPFAAMGSRLGMYDLERICEAAEPFERAFCLMDTPRALDDAVNLRRLLAGGDLDLDE